MGEEEKVGGEERLSFSLSLLLSPPQSCPKPPQSAPKPPQIVLRSPRGAQEPRPSLRGYFCTTFQHLILDASAWFRALNSWYWCLFLKNLLESCIKKGRMVYIKHQCCFQKWRRYKTFFQDRAGTIVKWTFWRGQFANSLTFASAQTPLASGKM